jgi:hypothetical protein
LLFFRKKFPAFEDIYVYLQQNNKEISHAYQICRKKLPRLRQKD